MSAHLDGLILIELLDLLEPAPAPEPISMMPQTAGWIWLGAAVAVGLFYLVRFFIRRRRANAYRRAGLAALKTAGDDPARIAAVLRRTALAGFPRGEVAHLTGDAWLAFLDRTAPDTEFSGAPGTALVTAPYLPGPSSAPDLHARAARWISRHKVPAAEEAQP